MFSFGICFKVRSFSQNCWLLPGTELTFVLLKGNQTKPVFVSSDALMLERGFQQDGGLSIINLPSAIPVKPKGLCL